MRKKILIFGACCLLAVGSLSGCGDKADDTKNAKTESTEKTDKKQTDKKADAKKEELKTIGTKAEGESVISVTLKNSTRKRYHRDRAESGESAGVRSRADDRGRRI